MITAGCPLKRVARRVLRRVRPDVALLVLALSLLFPGCASRITKVPPSRGGDAALSFVIDARRLAGLRVTPDTSYRRTLRYFSRAGQRPFSSFTNGLCRLRFDKIGLSISFFTLDEGPATPANCRFGIMAVASDSRWHTTKGLRVGTPLASLRRLYPRAYNSGKLQGEHWSLPTGSTRWELVDPARAGSAAARPILVAYVRAGRVVALGVEIVGH